jgi:flavorubredoxin
MASRTLFESSDHKNVLLEESIPGDAEVQSNQHLILHKGGALILDPGGHNIYTRVLGATLAQVGGGSLDKIFLSHQDPDIVASINGWLMTTDAIAYASSLWLRFIPHFGLDRMALPRLRGIPDEGMLLDLRGLPLVVLPAHFLHSPGNFQLYDPASKILYSGDLGAGMGNGFAEVTDFDAHLPFMLPFHQRVMPSARALKAWAKMIRRLDIECIAPQHGGYFRGKVMVERFISWCETLEVGADLADGLFRLPT